MGILLHPRVNPTEIAQEWGHMQFNPHHCLVLGAVSGVALEASEQLWRWSSGLWQYKHSLSQQLQTQVLN